MDGITVNFSVVPTENVTADDITLSVDSHTFTGQAGEDSVDITVSAEDDGIAEQDEIVTVNMEVVGQLPDGWSIGAPFVFTIPANDNTVGFEDPSSIAVEENTNIDHAVTLDVRGIVHADADLTLSVDVASTAMMSDDFTLPASVAITSSDSNSEVIFNVTIIGDTMGEEEEIITLNIDVSSLPEGFVLGNNASHRITIPTNDYYVGFKDDSSDAFEGDANTHHAVTLTVKGPITADASITFSFDGESTAKINEDFMLPASVAITSSDSDSEVTFNVIIVGDDTGEEEETIILNINESSLPVDFTLDQNASHRITIPGNDYSLGFQDASSIAPVADTNTSHTVTLAVTGTTNDPSGITFMPDDRSTAFLNEDFILPESVAVTRSETDNEVTFNVAFDITIVGDNIIEEEEVIILNINQSSLPEGFALGRHTSHMITIPGNDLIARSIGFAEIPGRTNLKPAENTSTTISAAAMPAELLPEEGFGVVFSVDPPEAAIVSPTLHTFTRDAPSVEISVSIPDDNIPEYAEPFSVIMKDFGILPGRWTINPVLDFTVPANENTIELLDNSLTEIDDREGIDEKSLEVLPLVVTIDRPFEDDTTIKLEALERDGDDIPDVFFRVFDASYNSNSSMLVIPSGVDQINLNVEAVDDNIREGEEQITVRISDPDGSLPNGWSFGRVQMHSVTISPSDSDL